MGAQVLLSVIKMKLWQVQLLKSHVFDKFMRMTDTSFWCMNSRTPSTELLSHGACLYKLDTSLAFSSRFYPYQKALCKSQNKRLSSPWTCCPKNPNLSNKCSPPPTLVHSLRRVDIFSAEMVGPKRHAEPCYTMGV